MARDIDEKIVQMRFENSDFERKAKETIKSIDELNKSTESMGENSAAFDKLIQSLDQVNQRFSLMETVARGALERIGGQIADTGMNLAKSLSIDQVTAGWSKYEEKTRAVKTIMNATGDSIDTVNGYLGKLMWYTDETSYNFVDMTSNIGKFTAQGIALDDATTAMMGISNWAAQAGQGVQQASMAMYNLSQSIGAGTVMLRDWMSVENANMGTKEFKELAIETAKELGTLSEAAEDAKGEIVTFQNFRDTLQDDWFTSDVLIATLKKYGEYTEEVYKITQEEGISAAEAIKKLGDAYDGVGKSAFLAAQVSKTFSDAVDATADAVSSRWLAIFEAMFGNLVQQELFWTEVTSHMYDAFADGLDAVLEGVLAWQEMGGSLEFLSVLDEVLTGLVGVIQLWGNAWNQAFGPITGEGIQSIARAFEYFLLAITPTEMTLRNLASILSGVMSVVGVGVKYVIAFAKGFEPLVLAINQFLGAALGILGISGDLVTMFAQWIASEQALSAVTETTRTVVQGLVDILSGVVQLLGGMALAFYDAFQNLSFSWESGITGIDKFTSTLKKNFAELFKIAIPEGFNFDSIFGGMSEFFSDLATKLPAPLQTVAQAMTTFFDSLKNVGQNGSINWSGLSVGEKAITALGIAFQETGKFLDGSLSGLESFSAWLRTILGPLGTGVKDFLDYVISRVGELNTSDIFDILLAINIGNIIKPMESVADAFNEMMSKIGDTLETFQSKIKTESFMNIAKAITILAVALLLVSKVPVAQLAGSAAILAGLGGALTAFMYAINKITDEWDDDQVARFKSVTVAMIPLTATILMLSSAAKSLASLDLAGVAKGVLGVGVLLAELAGFTKLVDGLTIDKKGIAGLISVAAAIKLLVKPITQLGALDLPTLAKGLGAVGIAIAELAGFTLVAGNVKGNVAGAAAGMILLAGAMAILAPEILLFTKFEWDTLKDGLLKMASVLVVVTAAMAALSLAGAQGLAGAAGITALAVALALLMPQIALVGQFSWDTIGKAILTFTGVLGVFVAAAWALSPVAPIFLALAGGITAINASIALILVALGSFTKALPLAAAAVVAFGALSKETISGALENIQTLLEGLIDVFIALKVKLKLAAITYLSGILEALVEMAPDIANGVMLIIEEILHVLNERLPDIMVELDKLLTNLTPYVGKFAKHGCEIITGFVQGILDCLWNKLGDVVSSIGEWLDAAIMGGQGKARKAQLSNYYAEQGRDIKTQIAKNSHEAAQTFAGQAKKNESVYKQSGWMETKAYYSGMDAAADRHSPPGETVKRADEQTETWVDRISAGLTKVGESGKGFIKSFLKGVDDESAEGTKNSATKTANTFDEEITKSNLGKSVGKKVAKEIDEDKEAEKAAKKKAEKIREAFETEFSKIDIRRSKIGSEYDIAEAYLGPDPKEAEVNLLRLEELQKDMKELAKKYVLSYNEYQNTKLNPKATDLDIDTAYKDYLGVYAELAQKANELATQQKTMYGTYESIEKEVQRQVTELAAAQASLINSEKVVFSEATKEAYQNFVTATTDTQKQYYYDLWNDLKQKDAEGVLGEIIAKPIDAAQIRAEIYKNLGLDPNNPVQAFSSVNDLIKAAVETAKQGYMTGVAESYPGLIQEFETQVAQSASEVIEFTEEAVAPDFRRSGERMVEATSEGIEIKASVVSNSAKQMSKTAAQETNQNKGDWTEVGMDMMHGVAQGIREGASEVINAAIEVAESALQAAKQAMGISSPSKEFMAVGMYMAEGMAEGMLNTESAVATDARDVSNVMVDQFSDVDDRIQRILDASLHPVIQPSVDMTGVKRATKNLDNIWSSSTLRAISDISMSELDRRDEIFRLRQPVAPVVNNENNFTQNNYSPKSLSDAEIYMQTKRELNWAFKGAKNR